LNSTKNGEIDFPNKSVGSSDLVFLGKQLGIVFCFVLNLNTKV